MTITNWKPLGKSVKGADLLAATLGKSEKAILVLACLHGDEQQGKFIALKLLAYYEENFLALKDKKLVVVPVANPDGYTFNQRTNCNGVDLNRNFPTKNWQLSKEKNDFYSGDKPASEPETLAIRNLIDALNPQLIISLHQPYKVINYDGPAEKISTLMAKFNKYKIVQDIGYPTPGSLGTYAGVEKQIPTITLELPENEPNETVWKDNSFGLIAVINHT